MDSLNSNSDAIIAIAAALQVIITGALVGITYYYAQVTKKILGENRQMRIDAEKMRVDVQKPKIAIYPLEKYEKLGRRNEAQSIYFCVENVGRGPAYNVKFEMVNPSFSLPGNRLLKDIPLINHGTSYLPSGHKRSNRLSNAHEYSAHDELMQQQTQIKVTYKDSRGKTYDDCMCFDFRITASQ